MTKKQQTKRHLSATDLRLILSIGLFLTLTGMAAGFYFTFTALQPVAESTAKIQSEAKLSDAKVQGLISTEKELKDYSTAIRKSELILADPNNYQSQVIDSLTRFASIAEVSITSFTFQEDNTSSTSGQPSASADQASQAEAPEQPATDGSSSLKSIRTTIQLNEATTYQKLLHFIYLVEHNITRMQISSLSLAPGSENGSMGTQTLEIEVYVK